MIKMSNHISNVPFIHIAGAGDFLVDEINVDMSVDVAGFGAAVRMAPAQSTIHCSNSDGLKISITGSKADVQGAFTMTDKREWSGEGEPVPGQRVKIDGGQTGVVVLIGDFKLDKQRGAIIKMDGSGHLTMPMIISSLRPIERQLTTYEENNIAAVERLVSAGVISEDLGKEAIQRVKDGTKS